MIYPINLKINNKKRKMINKYINSRAKKRLLLIGLHIIINRTNDKFINESITKST
ncbi:hypothetical protein LSO9J_270002 [Candidatus Liberibacter solanacearum]